MIVQCLCSLFTLTLALAEFTDPHCGGKQVIVHLFEWKWTDIASECERFLSQKGYCGVQVSPPNEHAVIKDVYMRPWWERYQPVSYKLISRSGTEEQFKDMVRRCKSVGVRVYVDAVINHMTGVGRSGIGTAGSPYNADNFYFPGVPYNSPNFHHNCPSANGHVTNETDPNEVRNCQLVGLLDLDQSQNYVQQKIADYFNHLIDIGVAGFRVDAAKNMWPVDIQEIQSKVKDLPEGGKAFYYQDVIDEGISAVKVHEYTSLGYVTELRYCKKIALGINNFTALNNLYEPKIGMVDPSHAFIFVDNHDNQRGHGAGGDILTFIAPREYKMAQTFTLAYNYGFVRVLSSYAFGQDANLGPPHTADYVTKDVSIDDDGSCGDGWVCEHRWKAIANMVAFRNAVVGTNLNHWRNENNLVSFARGNKGFFAMANQGNVDTVLQTGLPAGQYCDLITDCLKTFTVDITGNVRIQITNNEEPMVAFIVGKSPVSGYESTTTPHSLLPVPKGWSRTVIFIEAQTESTQSVFIRGGIDENQRQGCTNIASTSACAIPIRFHDLHVNTGPGELNDMYSEWRKGDHYLDWYGPEPSQGSFHGVVAQGTPALLTTNFKGHVGYVGLNTYGDHYWLVDVEMDCTKTEDGWFEFKALVGSRSEKDVHGSGCGAGSPPYASNHHWARCGAKNVFHFNSPTCNITNI